MPLQKIERVLVIGAGAMGRGIAQWLAQQNVTVTIMDQHLKLAQSACDSINASWQALLAKQKITATQMEQWRPLVTAIADLSEIKATPQLCLEAIIEDLGHKQELFKKLHARFGDDCHYASNTSSLSLAQLATVLPQSSRGQFFGMHFFNPAPIMKLVELVQVEQTAAQTQLLVNLKGWLEARAKVAVICRDRPGLIVNRLARNYYGEAMRLATPYDQKSYALIDKIMTHIAAHPMGPFALMDFIGLDVNLSATKSVWQQCYHPARLAPHFLQEQLVQALHLGKKSDQGFYHYPLGAPAVDLIAPSRHAEHLKHVAIVVNSANHPLWAMREKLAERHHVFEYRDLEDLQRLMTSTSFDWIVDATVLAIKDKHPLLQFLHPKAARGMLCEPCGESIPFLRQLYPNIRAFSASALVSSNNTWEACLSDHQHAPDAMAILAEIAGSIGNQVLVHFGDHLIVPAIIAMLVNEAHHAKVEGLCREEEMDLALRYGTNYPRGPWQWQDLMGAEVFYYQLLNRALVTHDERYAPHTTLRQAAHVAAYKQITQRGLA